jgi:hypothetical protein
LLENARRPIHQITGHTFTLTIPYVSMEDHLVSVTPELMQDENEYTLVGESCPICFDAMNVVEDDVVRMPFCPHAFCRACITESIKRSPRCPLCRTSQ